MAPCERPGSLAASKLVVKDGRNGAHLRHRYADLRDVSTRPFNHCREDVVVNDRMRATNSCEEHFECRASVCKARTEMKYWTPCTYLSKTEALGELGASSRAKSLSDLASESLSHVIHSSLSADPAHASETYVLRRMHFGRINAIVLFLPFCFQQIPVWSLRFLVGGPRLLRSKSGIKIPSKSQFRNKEKM